MAITVELSSPTTLRGLDGYAPPPLGAKADSFSSEEGDVSPDLRETICRKRLGAAAHELLRAAGEAERVGAVAGGAPFDSSHFDFARWAGATDEALAAFILSTLGESKEVIGTAVVRALGGRAALYLLHLTLSVQAAGGMPLETEGRNRTAGGAFVMLLREHPHLDRAAADGAWAEIKRSGAEEKKRKAARSREGASGRAGTTPVGGGRAIGAKHALPLSHTPLSKFTKPSAHTPAEQPTPLALDLETVVMSES